ncbi:MAG: Tetratricopeptide 2 repeat protein [Deltaproteobacteria bacterium]|jgi:tetratricopeptide (TPR) repeat protein|nr:Tetratricopeptide 2 repeat protein [Deltaproteobacteria bacterium]
MEENGILDACRKALSVACLLMLLSSCSLPRIAILHDPLTPEEHINLGVSYEKRGEFDAALEQYAAASSKEPLAYLYMGNAYFQKGDLKEAEKSYRQAIDRTHDARAYNNLAWLYYTTGGRLEEAEALARKAVELAPGSLDFQDTLRKIIEKRSSSHEGR